MDRTRRNFRDITEAVIIIVQIMGIFDTVAIKVFHQIDNLNGEGLLNGEIDVRPEPEIRWSNYLVRLVI